MRSQTASDNKLSQNKDIVNIKNEKSLGRATSANVKDTAAFRTSETDKSIADSNEIVKGNFENGIKYSKKGSAQKYEGLLNIAKNDNGKVFYDITNLTEIQTKKVL